MSSAQTKWASPWGPPSAVNTPENKKKQKKRGGNKEYEETFYRDDNKAGMFCLSTKRKVEEVVGGELNDERSRKRGRRDHLLL